MLKSLLVLWILMACGLADHGNVWPRTSCEVTKDDIYQFSRTLLETNTEISMEQYRGKVLLIYNTATYCGLAVASYEQMNTFNALYEGQDLKILGFPSNIFGKQEPGVGYAEITNGIKYVIPGLGEDSLPDMDFFIKEEVNGANEPAFYTWLKAPCPTTGDTFSDDIFYSPVKIGDILWGFEKFLVGRDGKPYSRFHHSKTSFNDTDIIADIDFLLSQPIPST